MKLGALILLGAAVAALVPLGVRSDGRSMTAEWSLAVTPLTAPAAPNSAQPQLTVQGDHAVLSWIERSGDTSALRFSERSVAGWTDARTVASGANWFVNWADEQRSQFRIRRVEPGGAKSPSRAVAGIAAGRSSGYPRLARRGDELLFAWTEVVEKPQVRTAVARLHPVVSQP